MRSSMSRTTSRRRKAVLAGGAGGVAGLLALAGPIGAAMAQNGGTPVVTASQTVKVQLDPQGRPGKAYLFTQVEAHGTGKADVEVPTSTSGLRNLDGFGGAQVKDGKASWSFDVNGTAHQRTVATFTKSLPVSVQVSYTLDGKPVAAGDLAGRSGLLGVTYRVKNVSAAPTQITYQDGAGKTVTETVPVVTPYVGQLQIDLPSTFDDVRTSDDRADQAGNGRGGSLLAWTMVLFEPIGQVEQTFGFTAQVSDLALPSAHVQLLPVVPSRHPELKFGQDGFESGAKTGRDLTAGATEIDANLLKLQAGAAKLLAGLTQLQTGADQLHTGLAAQALPGAQQLSTGLGQARAGATQLSDGLSDGVPKLIAGAQRLAAGGKDAADGSGKLAAGAAALSKGFYDPAADTDLVRGSQDLAGALGLISGGIGQLDDASTGLPAAKAGAVALKSAIDTQVIPGLGLPTGSCDPAHPTLIPCTGLLRDGLTQLATSHAPDPAHAGLPTIQDGVAGVLAGINKNPTATDASGDPGLRRAMQLLNASLAQAVATGGSLDQGAGAIKAACGPNPVCTGTVDAVFQQIKASSQQGAASTQALLAAIGGASDAPTGNPATTTLTGALNGINGGLGNAISALDTQVLPGLTGVRDGLLQLRGGLTNADANGGTGNPACNPSVKPGAAGYCGISEGLDQLVGGLTAAVSGLGQLAPGAQQANEGAGSLAEGIAQAGDGAKQLADGSAQLSSGLSGQLAPGARQLAAGAAGLTAAQQGAHDLAGGLGKLDDGGRQLASGLTGAAEGSAQIAAGLTQAQDGDRQVVHGAGQLSAQGTRALVSAGNEAATSYGRQFAVMQALNAKGAEAMPYGQPTGTSDARAAYDLSIEPVGHVGATNNAARGGIALAVLAAGAVLATGLRRVVR